MKFYICNNRQHEAFDCAKTLREAMLLIEREGGGYIEVTNVQINSETVRRLLGNLGGYANSLRVKKVGGNND